MYDNEALNDEKVGVGSSLRRNLEDPMRFVPCRYVRMADATRIAFVLVLTFGGVTPVAAQWYRTQTLTAFDAAANDFFGASIGVSGHVAVIGAPFDDETGTDSGSAYVYSATTGLFLYQQLTPSDSAANDWFGYSAAISGNTAIVGSVLDDDGGSQSGSAYLFDITTGTELFKLTASDAAAGDNFGHAVGISGTRAIVGSIYDDDGGSQSGSAYLFDATNGLELFKLSAMGVAAGDAFGAAVAISGNRAVVGAGGDDDFGSESGAAYLFDALTGSELFKLTASDASAGRLFGNAVAIDGNIAIVGAPAGSLGGAAYLFDVTTGAELFKLTPSDGAFEDFFGASVAISGNRAVVGAWGNDDFGNDSGAAYVFDVTTGLQLQKLTAEFDASAGATFGYPVAIDGDVILAGASAESSQIINAGAVYKFDQYHQWTSPTSGDWDTAGNWSSGAVPNSGAASVYFGDAATGPTTVTVDFDATVGGIVIDNSTHSYRIEATGGNHLTLDRGDGDAFVEIVNGTHTLASVASDYSLVLSGQNRDTSKVVLEGANPIRGLVSVSGLTLELAHQDALGGNTGELLVYSGASIESNDAYIGRAPGTNWTAVMYGTGPNSASWNADGDFYVGYQGAGTLRVLGEGIVSAGGGSGSVVVAALPGSLGIIAIGYGDAGTIAASEVTGGLGNARILFQHNEANYVFAPALTGSLKVELSADAGVGTGTTILNGTNTYTGTTDIHGGKLVVNGSHSGGGAYTVHQAGTLGGSGSIEANITSHGKIAPGNSPGTLEIDGNLDLEPTSVLEIEIAGINPDEFDRVVVTGTANLDGRLDVPIIDGFVPQVGDRFTFLVANEVVGQFASVSVSSLGTVNPNAAFRYEANFTSTAADITFVAPETDITFASIDQAPDWSEDETWVGDGVPETVNVIEIDNLAGAPQQVNVATEDAFVHSLVVASSSDDSITIGVQDGRSLSAIVGTKIGHEATIALGNHMDPMEQGNLVSSAVEVQSGGALVGNGTVVGDLAVGVLAGNEEATLRPGYSVGHLTVEGDYRQGAVGVLRADVAGEADGQFDTVAIAGEAQLGGIAQINASLLAVQEAGITVEILSAEGGLGGTRFEDVVTEGGEGIYFVPSYSADGFQVTSALEGDMNPAVPGLDASDIDAFALGLMNPNRYRQSFGLSPGQACTCNGDGRFDFSDINRFVEIMENGGVLNPQAVLLRALTAVPEPNSAALLAAGVAGGIIMGRQTQRRKTGPDHA